jgi:hypothetical protein
MHRLLTAPPARETALKCMSTFSIASDVHTGPKHATPAAPAPSRAEQAALTNPPVVTAAAAAAPPPTSHELLSVPTNWAAPFNSKASPSAVAQPHASSGLKVGHTSAQPVASKTKHAPRAAPLETCATPSVSTTTSVYSSQCTSTAKGTEPSLPPPPDPPRTLSACSSRKRSSCRSGQLTGPPAGPSPLNPQAPPALATPYNAPQVSSRPLFSLGPDGRSSRASSPASGASPSFDSVTLPARLPAAATGPEFTASGGNPCAQEHDTAGKQAFGSALTIENFLGHNVASEASGRATQTSADGSSSTPTVPTSQAALSGARSASSKPDEDSPSTWSFAKKRAHAENAAGHTDSARIAVARMRPSSATSGPLLQGVHVFCVPSS